MAPISIIPPEILGMIFLYFRPARMSRERFPKALCQLSLVCRLWRAVIIGTPTLWTRIVFITPEEETSFEAYLSLFDVLLDRTGLTLPLDVLLKINDTSVGQQFDLLRLLMKKAPFHRWRSLELRCSSSAPLEFSLSGEFAQLETLTLYGTSCDKFPLLPVIDRTASKIRELTTSMSKMDNLMKLYPRIANQLSTLTSLDTIYQKAFNLPRGITKVHFDITPNTALAHVVHLKVDFLGLSSLRPSNFPEVRHLEVSFTMSGERNGEDVILPVLHHLTLRSPSLVTLPRIVAPSLQSLFIGFPQLKQTTSMCDLDQAVNNPRYQLSPASLTLDTLLTPETILKTMSISPRLETLTVLLHEQQAEWFAEALLEQTDPAGLQMETTWKYCPYLTSIRIKLKQKQANTERWRQFLSRILHGRSGNALRSGSCVWEDMNEVTVML